MMNRNVWVLPLTVFLLLIAAISGAQQAAKVWKIGVLVSGNKASNAMRDDALREGLRQLGYEENRNIVWEYRYAEGKTDRLPQLAREAPAKRS
jgi:ABC-type uncharacterized transport system substrate-binding protein